MKLVEVNEVPVSKHFGDRGAYFKVLMEFKEKNAKFCELKDFDVHPKAACAGLQHAIKAHGDAFDGIRATRRGDRVFIIRKED